MQSAVSKFLSEIGKKGGAVKNSRKARACRANGRKGGRPRKHIGQPDGRLEQRESAGESNVR